MSTLLCATALVLLLDVSDSVSDHNFKIQRDGIAQTFTDEDIINTVTKGDGVVISVVQWSNIQKTHIGWTMLKSREDVLKFSNTVKNMDRSSNSVTGLFAAIRYGIAEFDKLPCEPVAKVIDISGDGKENMVTDFRMQDEKKSIHDELANKLITVNGLPIIAAEQDLDIWYTNNVITPDGFIVIAKNEADFARAIRMKLIREIAENFNKKRS